jgi:asparagine synthase (glutamine-hydrolysing)
MCGILGIVAPLGSDVGVTEDQMRKMRDKMTARGPDSAGSHLAGNVAFAHRRLAIRDHAGGAQPWWSDDQRVVMVYNGELYNDDVLRQRLIALGHRFRSRCDTEVVLAAYLHWGDDFLTELHGMFALGIYDYRGDRLLLARDRCGVKPLFLTEINSELAFASSISALLAHPDVSKQPDFATISHYLTTFRTTLGRQSLYRGIWQLLPAEKLVWHDGRFEVKRYWDYPADEDESLTYEDAVEQLHVSLRTAVQTRLVSDVPVGMFLSGGVDSSTIASLVHEQTGQSMLGVCGGGDLAASHDFDFAARCAEHVGFEYDETRVDAAAFSDCWQWMVDQNELPLATPSDVIIYKIAQRLKQSVGVALGGEGADELLCGYAVQHWSGLDYDGSRQIAGQTWSHGDAAAMVFGQALHAQYGRDSFTSVADHYFALNSLIPATAKPALLQPWAWDAAEHDAVMNHVYRDEFSRLDALPTARQHARILHQVNLESLLARLDGATMLASLEARVPYTDHKLVEQMFRIPWRFKIDAPTPRRHEMTSAMLEAGGHIRSKRVLRSLAQKYLPAPLAQRRKASFPTPVREWLATDWSDWAGRRLRASSFLGAVIRPAAIDELSSQPAAAGMWLWPLLNLAMWGDRQFCTEPPRQSVANRPHSLHAFESQSSRSANRHG